MTPAEFKAYLLLLGFVDRTVTGAFYSHSMQYPTRMRPYIAVYWNDVDTDRSLVRINHYVQGNGHAQTNHHCPSYAEAIKTLNTVLPQYDLLNGVTHENTLD